ncbi:MAG: hypothetical protein ACXADX_13685, partial [Candidatus Hodarchaeales archaeon]
LMSYNDSVTYSLLSSELNLKAGSVYHHLNSLSLGGLLEQRSDKSYTLTLKGKQAVDYLKFLDDPISLESKERRERSETISQLSPFIQYFTAHPRRSLLEIGFLFIIAVALGSEISVGVFGTFIVPVTSDPWISGVFLAMVGWFIILLVSEVTLRFFYNVEVDNHLNLLSGISSSLIGPTVMLIGLYLFVNNLSVENIDLGIAIFAEALLQIWMVLTISAAINETTKASFSQSLVIALIINYLLLASLFLFVL